jgi:predicted nucleotide-binding protein
LVFVLLTPDDEVAGPSDTNAEKRRARQNVIFEMGFFLGKLGSESGKILLLHKGPVDIPSDISGIEYIDITNEIESAGEKIRRELQELGVLR